MAISKLHVLLVILSIWIGPFLPSPVYSDDSMVGESGHTVFPINTDKVRMVSEQVTIKMSNQSTGFAANVTSLVECEFLFENTSSEEIIAKVGFPGNAYSSYQVGEEDLYDFTSYVSGVKASVQRKQEILSYAENDSGTKEPVSYRYWYTWDATFPPKEIISINNSYWFYHSQDNFISGFEYILTTGANWKGPIKKAVIEIIYNSPQDLKERVMDVQPGKFKIKENKIGWEFENLIPEENIRITEINVWAKTHVIQEELYNAVRRQLYVGDVRLYREKDINIEKNRKAWDSISVYASAYKGVFNKDMEFMNEARKAYTRVIRNEIFARHGRIFKSEDLMKIFGRTEWYKPDPSFSDDKLNDYERKNIEFILAYEKEMGWR